MNKDINKLVWLVLPIVVAMLPYAARFMGKHTDSVMYRETGVIENLTVIFLLVAIISTVLFLISNRTKFKFLSVWMGIFLLGAIYYAGEEVSWGQHLFGWGTPEQWTEVNDQQETNLHNTHAIFDQIPRTALLLGALIGGVLIPLYRRFKHHRLDENSLFDWILPTIVCLPAGLLTLLVSWQKIFELVGQEIPVALNIRAGETKECMLSLFLMMYALSIWYRNRLVSRSSEEAQATGQPS